jgi:hypothetical protein
LPERMSQLKRSFTSIFLVCFICSFCCFCYVKNESMKITTVHMTFSGSIIHCCNFIR